MLKRPLGLVVVGLMAACGGDSAVDPCGVAQTVECSRPDGGLPTGTSVVVDIEWLRERIDDLQLQLVDARGTAFGTSRIPGAISLIPSDLSGNLDGVDGQLVDAERAEPTLRQKGLHNGGTVVVYGESPEYNAARIVWALRYYGHGDVRYLDGGYDAWVAAGGPTEDDPPSVDPSEYTIEAVAESLRVTGDWVLEQLGDEPYDMPRVQLVDARSTGEHGSAHIPTARNVDWNANLDGDFLQTADDLALLYQGMDRASPAVTYCASGLRGSFAWLTLVALGFDDVALYDGSWNEWSALGYPSE